jgi:hypothetical protein
MIARVGIVMGCHAIVTICFYRDNSTAWRATLDEDEHYVYAVAL